jgi:hypothetical protein
LIANTQPAASQSSLGNQPGGGTNRLLIVDLALSAPSCEKENVLLVQPTTTIFTYRFCDRNDYRINRHACAGFPLARRAGSA